MTYPFHTLFLCTGNSARSILAEAILAREGAPRFIAHSAGSQPTGAPNRFALSLLAEKGFDTGFARSKSWDEFAGPAAPHLDFIFTVCDSAAAETCPFWPRPSDGPAPLTAHWGLPDPAAVTGSHADISAAFAATYDALERRIRAFTSLDPSSMTRSDLALRLKQIGTDSP